MARLFAPFLIYLLFSFWVLHGQSLNNEESLKWAIDEHNCLLKTTINGDTTLDCSWKEALIVDEFLKHRQIERIEESGDYNIHWYELTIPRAIQFLWDML